MGWNETREISHHKTRDIGTVTNRYRLFMQAKEIKGVVTASNTIISPHNIIN
jgi:hypothetical protein